MAAVVKAEDGPRGARFDNPAALANMRAHERARDAGHTEWVERAKKYDRMYLGAGKQWEDELRTSLEAQGRPALEINLLLGHINTVLGEIQDQRVDWQFSADDDDAEDGLAEINALGRRIREDVDYTSVEATAVADGVIQDRGYIDVRMDFQASAMGRVAIAAVDPLEVELSPEAKEYDPATWPEVTRTRWYSLDDVETDYGKEHRQALEDNAANLQHAGYDNFRFDEVRFGDSRIPVGELSEDTAKLREVRIIERQHKQITRRVYLVDLASGDENPAPDGMTLDQAEALAKKVPSLFVQRRFESRVRWTVSCGGYLIHDEWSPYKTFTVVPFFPIFRRGRPLGLLANQVSPQEQVNKLESQVLHVVNTTANSGYVVEAGSLVNMSAEELEARGAETGLVLVYRQGRQAPAKITPNSIPAGLDHAASKAAANLSLVAGAADNTAVEGEGGLLATALGRGGKPMPAALNPVMANLARTRRMVAQRVLDLIQTFYRAPASFRTREFDGYEFQSKTHQVNTQNADGSVSADMSTGRYGITVTTTAPHESARSQQFAYAMEMKAAGLVIPDDYIIAVSPLEDRKQLAERSRQMQGMGEPSEEEQQLLALQQRLAVETAMAELATLQAEAQERMANAQLAMSKAGAAQSDAQTRAWQAQTDARERMARIQADVQKHFTNLQNKVQLAEMHIGAKNDQTRLSGLQKRALENTRQQGQQETALLQASLPRPQR